MKESELNYRSGNSFLMGAGGSGKTHTLHAILNEKPPRVRQSTECVKNPVRAVAQCKVRVHEKTTGQTSFNKITDQQYSDMLCESAKNLHTGKELFMPQSQVQLRQQGAIVAYTSLSAGNYTSLLTEKQTKSVASASSKRMHNGLERELVVRMHAGSKATD